MGDIEVLTCQDVIDAFVPDARCCVSCHESVDRGWDDYAEMLFADDRRARVCCAIVRAVDETFEPFLMRFCMDRRPSPERIERYRREARKRRRQEREYGR